MRDPTERLRDMLDIAAIERYLDRDKAVFESDELLQIWFLRHLQIIGEAARSVPEEVRALAPDNVLTRRIRPRREFSADFAVFESARASS